MKLPALITSDLHLTANPRDEYRWPFFPWLAHTCRKHHVQTLLILGDLTDSKDYHSAELVNRIADCLDRVSREVKEIILLTGNHDYLKEGNAFFAFLSHHPKIRFITKPEPDAGSSDPQFVKALYLPHSKNPAKDWKPHNFNHYEMIFMHQTVAGAKVSNGQEMTSSLPADFKMKPHQRIYSGDIHVPQIIGDVIYVGSPYPIHFGDEFRSRCILIEKDGASFDLHFKTLKRVTLDLTMENLDRWPSVSEGDQVKVRVHLGPADRPLWDQIRKDILAIAEEEKATVVSIELKALKERTRIIGKHTVTNHSPAQRLEAFIDEQDLGGDLLDAGLEILEGVK